MEWLGRHPRFVFPFTPTSCSWLNAVEGFFAKLTRRRLKRGVFKSVVDLQAAINRYLDEANVRVRRGPPCEEGWPVADCRYGYLY
jgi:transposase